jgi:hypothetical protein
MKHVVNEFLLKKNAYIHTCMHANIHTYHISRLIRRTVIFSLQILEKNNYECILILVIYWKNIGLLHTKISNHNIIYSSQKPRKSSLPLKSSSWLFSLDAGTGIYKFGNNTYPRRIRRSSNLGHIFQEKKCILWAGKYGTYIHTYIHTYMRPGVV